MLLTYLKTTQNDLLSCIKDFVQSEIVNDIQSQTGWPFFGVSADKVTDLLNWEQLGIVVHYVKNCQAIENLLEFVQCDDVKGVRIAEFIINTLNNAGLYPQMCCAQTYNGAGNMAGKEKGAAAKFCSETGNEKAVYFHCTSHKLNLSLSKVSKILQVMNMVSTMQMLGIFFKYSPKCQQKLEQSITEIATELLKKKVKPLCETC